MGLEPFELFELIGHASDVNFDDYETALTELVAAEDAVAAAEARLVRARESMQAAMLALGIDRADTEHGRLGLAKKPGKTNVAMSNAAFARKWPHLTKPDITAAGKAAKDDPELAEVLVYEEGDGLVLRFSRRGKGA